MKKNMASLQEKINLRNKYYKYIRKFFEIKDYTEVETPILVKCPGAEVYLDYFKTEWFDYKNRNHQFWLRSSPEIHLKQVIDDDMNKIFEISKSFRNNGELGPWHHPEFSLLEWYQTHITFRNFINMTEEFIFFVADKLLKYCRERSNNKISKFTFEKFKLISVFEAFENFAHIKLVDNDPDLPHKAMENGFLSVNKNDDFESAYFKILIDCIEPRLKNMHNVVLYDYPPSQASLAKIENNVAKRFEFYIHGIEICNGFSELTNYEMNKHRFSATKEKRLQLNKGTVEDDLFFMKALQNGMPDCCGNALGLDRLLAIILDKKSIDDILPFQRTILSNSTTELED